MCDHVRRFSSIYFVVLVLLPPFAARAQTSNDSLGKAVPRRDLPTEVSDETFRAVIKARDDKLAFAAELKQIKSYHDKLKSGLETLFLSLPISFRETYFKIIDDELLRLKQFEDGVSAEQNDKAKEDLAKQFSRDYPVVLNESKVVDFVQSTPNNNPIEFARRERPNASDVFQNVGSFENRQFFDGYKNVFATMESFGSGNEREPFSENLREFLQLAGATSYDTLTEPQIKSAINKYRDVLQRTRDNISKSPASGATFRTNVMKQVEALGSDLNKKSDDLKSQTDGLERDMTLTAKSLYGKTVGAESFNYLLLVFAAVFFAIMIIPKFYPPPVAENVLKSEFLLQFSTVFVLIAAIIILSIGGFIEKNQLPVLLAGISGYVLGQLGPNSRPSALPPAAGRTPPPT